MCPDAAGPTSSHAGCSSSSSGFASPAPRLLSTHHRQSWGHSHAACSGTWFLERCWCVLVVAFHLLSLNQQTVQQLPRKVSFPGHGTSSTLKSTQLPTNPTQSATWAPILLFFVRNKWCWRGDPSEEPSHLDCPALLWNLLAPLAFRSAGPISSPHWPQREKLGQGWVHSELGALWSPATKASMIWSHLLKLPSWSWLVQVIWMTVQSRE